MSSIKIATYNIWKNDGDFPDRIYDLSTQLRSKKLDVICFQEDYTCSNFSSSKFLNIELDFNYITTNTRKKLRDGILSSSNLTILSRYKVKLLEEVFFNKGEEEERAFQIIEVELKKEKLLLINTHLCHLSSKSRISQMAEILNYLEKYKNYDLTLFCGDLNAQPNSEEIRYLREKGFMDKNVQHSHENGVTIDYILYKTNFEDILVNSKIILKNYSDHYCLVNKFNF